MVHVAEAPLRRFDGIGLEGLSRHRERIRRACEAGRVFPTVVGMALSGSLATGSGDAFSDIDLVVVSGSEIGLEKVRERLIRSCGVHVARYSGEHVGEPRLVVVLYSDLIKVDFVFLEQDDLAAWNGGRPIAILWERGGVLSRELAGRQSSSSRAEAVDFLERRFWSWTWYGFAKLLRGERYEALSAIGYLRDKALFPALAARSGSSQRGARRIDELVAAADLPFDATVPRLEDDDLLAALRACVRVYRALADPLLAELGVAPAAAARLVVEDALSHGFGWRPRIDTEATASGSRRSVGEA